MPGPELIEVPATAALLAGIGAAIIYLASRGFLGLWRHSLGKILVVSAGLIGALGVTILGKTIHPFGKVAQLLMSLNHTVDHYIGVTVIWSGKGAAVLFKFFLDTQMWIAREIAGLATDTFHAIQALNREIARVATGHAARAAVKTVVQPVIVATTVSKAGLKAANARLSRLEKRVASMAHAIPHAIPNPWPRLKSAEKRIENQGKRLSRLEKGALGALGAAAVLTALKKLGLGWTRCNNVTKIGKRACGMDPTLLDSLLLGLTLYAGTQSVVRFAEAMLAAEDEMVGVLERMVVELHDGA